MYRYVKKKCTTKYTFQRTFVYSLRAETRQSVILFNKGICTSSDSNFLLLCACLWMIRKELWVFIWGFQINSREQGNSQMWNPQIIKVNRLWAPQSTRWWGYIAKKIGLWTYIYWEKNNKRQFYQMSIEEEVHLEDKGVGWTPWWVWGGGGIGEEVEKITWTEVGGVATVLGTGIRLEKRVEHRVKEAKNVVSGRNGARNLTSQ